MPGDWQRVEDLFFAALQQPPDAREAWLRKQCDGDNSLLEQVRELLIADSGAPERILKVVEAAARSADTSPAPESGRRIGPYVLVREVGRGGMGVVYQAVRADGEFFQSVAIKLIRGGYDNPSLVNRFRQERQMLARLDHPNIARLIDGGATDDGQPYYVMDFLEATPITDFSLGRKLSPRGAVELFISVCDGVEYAHDNGIVHRDLKPANILVPRDGRPKLLDFGIAKWLDPRQSPNTVVETQTGYRMLTPDYASPEQIRGEPATEATDIYALGAILYELLAGRKPHDLKSYAPAELARAICDTEITRPSEAAANPALAGTLDAIVLKAMAKEKSHRYITVGELADDLRRYLDGQPVTARIRSRRRPWIWAAAAAAAAILLCAVIALVVAIWGGKPAGRVTSLAVLPLVSLGGPESATLADGLTEDLITGMAGIAGLKVPSRTTVWQYRGKVFDLRKAGREMGVETLLEGSVRSVGDRVRVVVQLIDVRDGFHLWARTYDRPAAGQLEIQREVSQAIALDLKARILGERSWNSGGSAGTNAAAQKDFLEGYRLFHMDEIRKEWKGGIPPRLQAAIDAFTRAKDAAPDFAGAWAGLSQVLEWGSFFDPARGPKMVRQAEQAAQRALQIEPTNPQALETMGNICFFHKWDLKQADIYLRQAVEVNPRITGIQGDYADLLIVRGRFDEATQTLQAAQMIEPSSPRPSGMLAARLALRRKCEEANEWAQQSLSRDPAYRHARWAVAYCSEVAGNLQLAEQQYRAILRDIPAEQQTEASLGSLLARTGHPQEARQLAEKLEKDITLGLRHQVFAALVRTALGEHDAAMRLLQQAFDRRDPTILFLHIESRFAPLENDPRFQTIRSRVDQLR